MIEFHCKNCGQKLSVQEQHSGKRVKCPKCSSAGIVPDNSDKIKFNCENCGQSIRVPQIYAGKKGKCPKCKNVVVVPIPEATPAKSTSMVSFTCSMCDETVQVPETSIGKTIECPECGSYIETSSGPIPRESEPSADEYLYEEETEEYEESEGVDRRIIVGISAVAAFVVVGLIILVAVLRSSKPRRTERPQGLQAQRQVADTDSQPKPVTPNTQPEEPVPLEDRLYKQTKIAFESRRDGNYDIYVMNADGSEQKRLTKNRAQDSDPSWSPDGKKIAFRTSAQGNIEIYVMNADGSEQKNLTNNPASDWDPSWSPNGKKIAFSSKRDGNMEIYVMNADGSEQKNLTNNPAYDRNPSWSPDGTKIAFSSTRDGNPEIYVMNADGTEQKNLTNNRGGDRFPSWSPDGKKIAFSSQKYGFENIYVMNADGSEQRRLTNNFADEGFPSWSPDGMKIAFESDRDGHTNIYVMNADGSEQKRLTDNPNYDKTPSWSPFLPSVVIEELQKKYTQPTEPIVQEGPKEDSVPEEPVETVPLPTSGDIITNSIGMKLVYIPAGSFIMGSGDSVEQLAKEYMAAELNEFPQHQVSISQGFWMGQTEITQGQYKSVMDAQPWSGKPDVQESAHNPAVYVSWGDAVEFCTKLSQREGKTYRLPTEAEWEYACRAGTTTRFSFGDDGSSLDEYAWYADNAYKAGQRYAHSVGQKKPNPWGLYDMHGNVYEWCSDFYDPEYYANSPKVDPTGPSSRELRSLRSGSWYYLENALRCSSRYAGLPGSRGSRTGFRVVCSDLEKTPREEVPSHPETSVDYFNRGKAYVDKGQYDEAISDYNKAIEINPMYAEAYLYRGRVYALRSQYEQAISDFDKAIEINPGDAVAYYNRAVAYFNKRDYDKAWEDVRKAQSLGYKVHPGFLNALRKALGRRR